MKDQQNNPLAGMSMREILRMEVESQMQLLTENLLRLERGDVSAGQLEAMMRAAHSVKGGARIADLPAAVELAHAIEDVFVGAQAAAISLAASDVDLLLEAVDALKVLAEEGAAQAENSPGQRSRSNALIDRLALLRARPKDSAEPPVAPPQSLGTDDAPVATPAAAEGQRRNVSPALDHMADRMVRVSVESLDRLMGLVAELSMSDRHSDRVRADLTRALRQAGEMASDLGAQDSTQPAVSEASLHDLTGRLHALKGLLATSLEQMESHKLRSFRLTRRLQRELVEHRMRPFGEGTDGFNRLVRKVAQSLGKKAVLSIDGESTRVDRDILDKLRVPLTHLIQNAIDHGIETPQQRLALGKPAEGQIRISAQHKAGMLLVRVEDDGAGVDVEALRASIVEKGMVGAAMAGALSEAELMEFLFLPNLTLKQEVNLISGRGIGLDLVRNMVQNVRGTVRVHTERGRGSRFELTLPASMVLVRSLLVQIAGEAYAFPVARIKCALSLPQADIASLEARQYFTLDGHRVGLVDASRVLELDAEVRANQDHAVVVIGADVHWYAIEVERFLGESYLLEKPLDPRLGKIRDVSSSAVMEDGNVVLILDVDDLLRSIEKLVNDGHLRRENQLSSAAETSRRKRVLVVDDSITVREMERGLLSVRGYEVDVAVDGVDAWTAVRLGKYDLVVTDVDMPRMDGIELVRHIREDAKLKELPVVIVSYKDRQEDRMRGLEVGADYYLTKGSFQDDSFVDAVHHLIGEAVSQ